MLDACSLDLASPGLATGGEWIDPTADIEVVAMCADDLEFAESADARKRVNFAADVAAETGIPLFGSIAEALRAGGDTLVADAVLSIGEGACSGASVPVSMLLDVER